MKLETLSADLTRQRPDPGTLPAPLDMIAIETPRGVADASVLEMKRKIVAMNDQLEAQNTKLCTQKQLLDDHLSSAVFDNMLLDARAAGDDVRNTATSCGAHESDVLSFLTQEAAILGLGTVEFLFPTGTLINGEWLPPEPSSSPPPSYSLPSSSSSLLHEGVLGDAIFSHSNEKNARQVKRAKAPHRRIHSDPSSEMGQKFTQEDFIDYMSFEKSEVLENFVGEPGASEASEESNEGESLSRTSFSDEVCSIEDKAACLDGGTGTLAALASDVGSAVGRTVLTSTHLPAPSPVPQYYVMPGPYSVMGAPRMTAPSAAAKSAPKSTPLSMNGKTTPFAFIAPAAASYATMPASAAPYSMMNGGVAIKVAPQPWPLMKQAAPTPKIQHKPPGGHFGHHRTQSCGGTGHQKVMVVKQGKYRCSLCGAFKLKHACKAVEKVTSRSCGIQAYPSDCLMEGPTISVRKRPSS